METKWQRLKRFSDAYIPSIKEGIGSALVCEAPVHEDTHENTDLITLTMNSVRIACRIRRHTYYPRYKDEFTIRSRVALGGKTELRKVMEGFGDYLFYGFGEPDPPGLLHWRVGDLSVFRSWFNRRFIKTSKIPGMEMDNGDGSFFRVFCWNDLPEGFVIASGGTDVPVDRILPGITR